jgi:hypothetical protein
LDVMAQVPPCKGFQVNLVVSWGCNFHQNIPNLLLPKRVPHLHCVVPCLALQSEQTWMPVGRCVIYFTHRVPRKVPHNIEFIQWSTLLWCTGADLLVILCGCREHVHSSNIPPPWAHVVQMVSRQIHAVASAHCYVAPASLCEFWVGVKIYSWQAWNKQEMRWWRLFYSLSPSIGESSDPCARRTFLS